jgi:hypothetical protein
MSILSGFDAVVELGVGIIEEKLRAISIGGNPLDAPTEILVGDTNQGADLIILDPIGIALSVGTNGITISVSFDDSTVYFEGNAVRPLKGALTIKGEIDQVPANPNDSTSTLQDIGLIVRSVSVAWDSGSSTQGALAGLSSDERSKLEGGLSLLTMTTINENAPHAGLTFNTDETRNGLLGTFGLRFRSVQVQNIDAQTIGLFCVALLDTTAPASITRTEAGIVGKSGAAVSLSQATFQQLVFCPGVAQSLMAAFDPKTETADQYADQVSANMPSICGKGDYVPISGALKLVNVDPTFETGHIKLSGQAVRGKAGDVFCFRAVADFNTDIYMTVKNGAVSMTLIPDPPNINAYVEVSWFCFLLYFAAAFVTPITGAITIFLIVVGECLTNTLAPQLVKKPLDLNQTEQVGFDSFTLKSVDIVPDRLTLHGNVAAAQPVEHDPRGVVLQITHEEATNKEQVGSGIYHYPGSVVCPPKDYAYNEFTQDDVLTLQATPHLMGSDPSIEWTVGGLPLTDTKGTLTLEVPATIPQPGDLPGKDTVSLGMQTTTVDYEFTNPTTIQLTGHGDFDYAVDVAVEYTSLGGFTASDNLFAVFTNHLIEMLDNYDQDMAACALATRLTVDKLRTKVQSIPLGGDPLGYREAIQVVREAVLTNKVGAAETLAALSQTVGLRVFSDVLSLREEEE